MMRDFSVASTFCAPDPAGRMELHLAPLEIYGMQFILVRVLP